MIFAKNKKDAVTAENTISELEAKLKIKKML